MARPLKVIDAAEVVRLASIMCTQEEMALVLDCSVDTLQRRFAAAIEKGQAIARASLRRKQWDLAQDGDRTMLVWLGKQWLGQQDKQTVEHEGEQKVRVVIEYADEKTPTQ